MRSRSDLASSPDVHGVYVALSRTLAETRHAVLAHLERSLRRMVVMLSAVMVASAAAVMLVAWSAS